jgi:hypothetical protein
LAYCSGVFRAKRLTPAASVNWWKNLDTDLPFSSMWAGGRLKRWNTERK